MFRPAVSRECILHCLDTPVVLSGELGAHARPLAQIERLWPAVGGVTPNGLLAHLVDARSWFTLIWFQKWDNHVCA